MLYYNIVLKNQPIRNYPNNFLKEFSILLIFKFLIDIPFYL